jgi:hypothetical protein
VLHRSLNLEALPIATDLDFNQVWAKKSIRLDPDESRICNIKFPWGKYSYKWLPMDIAGPPNIFKTKMSELMRTLEKSEDDLLTKYQVTMASLSDHLDKL